MAADVGLRRVELHALTPNSQEVPLSQDGANHSAKELRAPGRASIPPLEPQEICRGLDKVHIHVHRYIVDNDGVLSLRSVLYHKKVEETVRDERLVERKIRDVGSEVALLDQRLQLTVMSQERAKPLV